MSRIIQLPSKGRLIAATDIQGNLQDFERVVDAFETAHHATKAGAYLVFTGDLVHGPEIAESDWPDYLGSFFKGDSVAVLGRAKKLAEQYPERVHFLLGNHEHAHIGGPIVAKFFDDEAARLESMLGPRRAIAMRHWIASWPLVAVAEHAGIALLHGAPAAAIDSPADLEQLDTCGGECTRQMMILNGLLWARSASRGQATRFLDALGNNLKVAVFGHDVVRGGHAIEDDLMLCISSSFGCYDGDKLYLDWDLSSLVNDAAHLADLGLRPLYPNAPLVYREPPFVAPRVHDTTPPPACSYASGSEA